MSIRVVFMGTPLFSVPALEALVRNNYQVAAVYTRRDKPSGRGQGLAMSPVKQAALALDIRVVQPASLKNAAAQAELADFSPDVIVVAAYGLILPLEVLYLPKFGCVNIHPSLLPRHRGAAPVMSTILSGDKWGGVTVMRVEEKLDSGPILAQSQVLVRDEDTTGNLMEKLSLIGAQMLVDVLPRWVKGEIEPRRQDDSQSTYFKMIEKDAGQVDWNQSAAEIWRQVRAYQPWPTSFTRFGGKVLKILEASPLDCDSSDAVGNIVALGRGCGVVSGHGLLELRRVQIEGKQAVSADDFIRGQRGFIGSRLPS
jgi:methionyl-tRNA formyltransferase